MRKLLLVTVAAVALLAPPDTGEAATIANLGVNPTSSQGAFNNAPGGGAFEDQFTFQLVGGPQFLTIASVTNVFPAPSDFITNFQAAVWTTGADGIVNNGDDALVIGPVATQSCPNTANCQFAAGSAILSAGNYYAELTGVGGGTSGYGGNIAVVPGPILGSGLGSLVLALGLFGLFRRKLAYHTA